jgi:hypothetical protein
VKWRRERPPETVIWATAVVVSYDECGCVTIAAGQQTIRLTRGDKATVTIKAPAGEIK